jgi:histidine triad (HIT) family protein
MKRGCVFCDIVNKKSPCFKIHEDANHIAFMDIFPPIFQHKITMPVILVATKKHRKSDIFQNMKKDEYSLLMRYARKIARAVYVGLKPSRVCMVQEGMEVNHAHLKLYPIHKKTYPGYLSTKKSEENKAIMASKKDMESVLKKIRKVLSVSN